MCFQYLRSVASSRFSGELSTLSILLTFNSAIVAASVGPPDSGFDVERTSVNFRNVVAAGCGIH